MNSSHTSLQLRPFLAARSASFARRHSHGYASSQELTDRTRQDVPHLTDGGMR